MAMDGMGPVLALVPQDPDLRSTFLDPGIHAVRLERLSVHWPQAAVVVECKKSPPVHRLPPYWRQFPQLIRNPAMVRPHGFNHIEAHDAVSRRRIVLSVRGSLAVCLQEPVLEVDVLTSLELRKVDNHVAALGNAQIDGVC